MCRLWERDNIYGWRWVMIKDDYASDFCCWLWLNKTKAVSAYLVAFLWATQKGQKEEEEDEKIEKRIEEEISKTRR